MSTVLLVEDEYLVRVDLAEALAELGHDVIEASNALDAIFHLESTAAIVALIADHMMPGPMTGAQLAWTVRERWPNVHIYILSGAKADDIGALPEDVPVLAKPFERNAMKRRLGKLSPVAHGDA